MVAKVPAAGGNTDETPKCLLSAGIFEKIKPWQLVGTASVFVQAAEFKLESKVIWQSFPKAIPHDRQSQPEDSIAKSMA